MSWAELGEAHAYLLRHRMVESKPSRRRNKGESRIAEILTDLDDTETLDQFQDLLIGQGFELVEYRDTQMPGIAPGGRVWMLSRRPDIQPPQYFSRDLVLERMALRPQEAKAATSVWYLHIWLIYLSVVYTDLGRGISEVGEYLRARFPQSILSDAVRQHCERLLSARPKSEDIDSTNVITILTDIQGADIDRRVRSFCSVMTEAGLLEDIDRENDETVYRQSLLGALEISRNYQSGIGLLEPGEDQLASLTAYARHHSDGDTAPVEEND